VAIPTGPAVVTSTLVVAGAPTYLSDLDVTTFITHTFAADLDITLTSPAGTVVTLTTDNGAGNDDVFNGTVWDDDANPGGQVPYTTNNGMVTDHAYVNATTATPLTPEEAFAAFIGENPNGTWTLTISDDLAGDGGSLNSWALDIDTYNCTVFYSGNVTTPITVNSGQNVVIQPGTNVTAPVTVNPGGSLTVTGANLSKGLTSNGAASLTICDSRINPPNSTSNALTVTNSNGPITIGDPAAGCAGNTFGGKVSIVSNNAGTTFGANTGNGATNIDTNSISTVIKANKVNAALSCTGNAPAPTNAGQPNQALPKSGQCASL
jgi:subtilisin-like proprotein convertase family protein